MFFALDLAINFLAPWFLYHLSRPHVDEAHAIMISAGAPAVWGLVQFARKRKVDAFSLLSLGGIALSLAILALGGSPKVLLVRESLIAGVTGVVFLVSALLRRPLMFALIRATLQSMPSGKGGMARAREEIELYAGAPWFRQLMATMTVGFGVFGIAEMAARMALAFTLPTERFLLVAPIARYVIAGIAVAWMYLYAVPAARRGTASSGAANGIRHDESTTS